MKRYRWLVALGLGAMLSFAVATLPASLVTGRLERYGVQVAGTSGSIWSGAASGLAWRGATLGDLEWHLTPLTLLRGRVAGHARLARQDGAVQTDFSVSFAGGIQLAQAEFALPVEALSDLQLGLPKGWRGRTSGRFAEVAISGGWPTVVRGELDLDDLTAPPPRNAAIGSFRAVLPHPQGRAPAGSITAQVKDKQGPFAVDAQLTLGKDRSFLLEGMLAPRGTLPQELDRALQFLGPADASGRRPFSVSGTL